MKYRLGVRVSAVLLISGIAFIAACGAKTSQQVCAESCDKGMECAAEVMKAVKGVEVPPDQLKAIKEQGGVAKEACTKRCTEVGGDRLISADQAKKIDECNSKSSCADYASCLTDLKNASGK
jgi:hypothetical protein